MVASEKSSTAGARENKRPAEEGEVKGRGVRSRNVASKKSKNAASSNKNETSTRSKNAGSKSSSAVSSSSSENGTYHIDPKIDALLPPDLNDRPTTHIYDFIRKVGMGEIAPGIAAAALRHRFSDKEPGSPLSFLLLDCIGYLLDTVTYRENMEAFIACLEQHGLVTSREVVASIDANKLDSCGYSSGLTTVAIRERTRNQFVLKSYGLWRECTVGFDLLQRVLYHHDWDINNSDDISRLQLSVKHIAGDFSLCPTRVLYELIAWCSWFDGDATLILLRQYPNDRVDEIVRLMLSQKRTIKQEYQTVKKQFWRLPSTIGPHFNKLCARLLYEGILVLSTLYGYLEPADSELSYLYNHFAELSKKKPLKTSRTGIPATHLLPLANCSPGDSALRSMITVARKQNLRMCGLLDTTTITNARDMINGRHAKLLEEYRIKNGLNISQEDFGKTKQELTIAGSEDSKQPSSDVPSQDSTTPDDTENRFHNPIDLVKYHLLDSDVFSYVRDHIFALECDKLSLLSHLIELCPDMNSSRWDMCKQLMGHIQWTVKFPIALHGGVCIAVCGLIQRIIAKATVSQDWSVCLDNVESLLRVIGPSVYIDLICLSSVLKMLSHCVNTSCDRVCRIIWMYILPAMALVVESNCQVADRLWKILSQLPASKRYGIYQRYMSNILEGTSQVEDSWVPLVRAAHNAALAKIRSLFKRVTSNMMKSIKTASVRGNVSVISGIAAVDPFAVAHTIITQCEMFENLVAPLSEIGKYFGGLGCDVLFFMLCSNQNQVCFGKSAEVDDLGRSKKLLVNAQLAARFFRRHVDIDICPLLVGALTVFLRSMGIHDLVLVPCGNNEANATTWEKHSINLNCLKDKYSCSYPDELSKGWLALEYTTKLLETAGGIPQLVEAHALTTDQLKAQGGGVLLRSEVMMQDAEDEICGLSSREALGRVLLRPLFCYSLLFLCGKMRQEVLYDSEFRAGISTLCGTVDQLQKSALQLVDFTESLNSILNRGSSDDLPLYIFNLPSFQQLRMFWEDANAIYLCHCNTDVSVIPDDALSHDTFKPEFMKFIWSIHLSDVWVPIEQYEKTLQRLNAWIAESESNHSSSGHRKLKKLRSRHAAIEQEFIKQKEHVEQTKKRFSEVVSSGWLSANVQIGPAINTAFLQHCIVPRVFINEAEASFCSHLVDLMLLNRVECFNFFDFSNCWTKMLMSMVRCCTEREAPLLAIFVNHAFHVIRGWIDDADGFEAMTRDHPCFCTTFKFVPDKALTHAQLMSGIRKWEGRIMRAISYALVLNITDADSSGEAGAPEVVAPTWIDQKGAIVFLARCHENFPITIAAGKRVLNGLNGVVVNAEQKGWKDVVVAAKTLVKTFEKYDRENRWI